jgi:hypothetical protein
LKLKKIVVEKEVPFEGSKTRDKEIGVVSIATALMTWSPKKIGGNKKVNYKEKYNGAYKSLS